MRSNDSLTQWPSMHLPDNAHIGIAGGGLLGRLLAWQLLRAGLRVSLFEAGSLTDSRAAAHTAAGMIAPVSEAIDSEYLMYELGRTALTQWPQWLSQLEAQERVAYGNTGSLIVAHRADASLLQQYQRDMHQMLPDIASPLLTRTELIGVEPDLNEAFQQGLLLDAEAHIDNRALLAVLLERIVELGGTCIEHTPVEVSAYQLSTNSDVHRFDCVLDCRGVGAKPQWSEVRGVRGEVLRVHSRDVSLSRPVRLLHPRYQLYVVPKPGGHFVIGATQIESEDLSPVSVQSSLELSSALYTISPAFAEARILELAVNLRPALRDNRPQIILAKGVMKMNGLYRHGYLIAPVVVQHVLARLLGGRYIDEPFASVLYTTAKESLSA